MPDVKKYRKKPVVIEAIQFKGGARAATPIINWILGENGTARWNETRTHDTSERPDGEIVSFERAVPLLEHIAIDTIDPSVARAFPGDWIIRGASGEFYPCKPDVFAETYDEVKRFAIG